MSNRARAFRVAGIAGLGALVLVGLSGALSARPTQSPAAERAARFEREDREYDRGGVREIHVPGVWKKLEGEGWAHVRRHATEAEQRFGPELVKRSLGFRQAVAVLPAGTRYDGTRMAPTCVFGLPNDGLGSIWFLTPDGLESECFTLAHAEKTSSRFGFAIDVGPDHDGDGIAELIIAAPGDESDEGTVYLFSVAERRVLLEVHAPTTASPFGMSACAVPDLDGDGREDLAILSGTPEPRVHVFSTNDCAVLREIELSAREVKHWWRPHHRMRVIPRDDGEPSNLLFVSMPDTLVDELAVIDLETRGPVWSIACPNSDEENGHWCRYSSVVTTEDLDGDGIDELLAAGFSDYRSPVAYAEYSVISGATGVTLRRTSEIHFGEGGDGEAFIADFPDIDCDGFREHIVGASGAFSRDAIVFSGRTGQLLYEINLGDLPQRYSNDIQSHVDWDEDGTLDLVMHDTDVWNYGTEQQLIVLSMADHQALHFVRPSDVERLILAREGWMENDAQESTASAHSLRPAAETPVAPKLPVSFEDVEFDYEQGWDARPVDDCEAVSDEAEKAAAKASVGGDKSVNAARAKAAAEAAQRAADELYARYGNATWTLGQSLAVIPGYRDAAGVDHEPRVAFGISVDQRGTLWMFGPGSDELQRYALPVDVQGIRRFGTTLDLTDDIDGDGALDLIVGAQTESELDSRYFAFSSAQNRLIHELAVKSKFRHAARTTLPDLDGDGVQEFAVLVDQRAVPERPNRCTLDLRIVSGKRGALVSSMQVETRQIESAWIQLATIGGGVEHPTQLVIGGAEIFAVDAHTGERSWSYEFEQPTKFGVMDLLLTQDLDSDGVAELLVGLMTERHSGELRLLSGRTGERLRTSGPVDHDCFQAGFSLSDSVDHDGDGYRESLFTRFYPFGCSAVLVSGRTGEALGQIGDPFAWDNGRFLDGSVDWDGKGLPDLVLGSNVPTTGYEGAELCVISMEDRCVLRSITRADMHRRMAREADPEDK